LSSSRRVKKGPGRRPLSAKRQRFMELRARGWSIRAAAREVEISRAAAANWTRGYKVYRRGQVVGFVPPLDRLEVREISTRFLSLDERVEIADLHYAGLSIRAIAAGLGRPPSTVSRELRRNAIQGRAGGYRPFDAHGGLPHFAPGAVRCGSTPTWSSARWSVSCCPSAGALNRSAATSASGSRKPQR
jgi:IS30 family transposase